MLPRRLKTLVARLNADERGNIMAITAAGMTAVVGAAGLGTDTIQWYMWKRQLQQSADAGALGGALAIGQGATQIEPTVRTEIARNANTSYAIVGIRRPPASGAYVADNKAVEVELTTQRALPFSNLFLDMAPLIQARAVAAVVTEAEHCVVALARTNIGVGLAGGANVDLGCGVAANSVVNSSVNLTGSSYLAAPVISAVGGIVASSTNLSPTTEERPYSTPQIDPLGPEGRNLQVPSSPASCTAATTGVVVEPNKPPQTLSPGRYCNGLEIKGHVTLSPGVYIVDKGTFKVSSLANLTGSGVTIVLTGSSSSDIATVDIDAGATVNLTAPTAAQNPTYKGVVFMQDPRAVESANEITGGSTVKIDGIMYFPGGNLTFTGGSTSATDCLLIAANRVTFTGSTKIANNCPPDYLDGFETRVVRVVE